MPNNYPPSTIHHKLSPELQFLISCCQVQPDPDEISLQIKSEKLKVKSWEEIISLSARHGILPLLYKTLKKVLQDDSPRSSRNTQYVARSTLLSELKPLYMSIVQRNMLMTSELIKIMKLLEENAINALAFKGPVLSQMAYGDITLRQYVDLDVLLRKEDIGRVDALLKVRGYQRGLEMTAVQEAVYMENAHDLSLYHPQKGVHFEMHWSLMNDNYPMQMDLDDIWAHPSSVALNDHALSTFSTENLLLYLCIHGSKHLWERIEWIKDLDLLIRQQESDGGEIDWEKVAGNAEERGFATMVYLGFALTSRLFNTPLPPVILERMERMKRLDVLSDFVLENWQNEQSVFRKTAAMLKLFPGTKERLVYLNTILIKPSLHEYRAVDLPKNLYWLYYFIRPYTLLKKYLMKEKNN